MPLDGDPAASYQESVAPSDLYLAQMEFIFWYPTFAPVSARLSMTLLTDEANADAISEALLGSATVVVVFLFAMVVAGGLVAGVVVVVSGATIDVVVVVVITVVMVVVVEGDVATVVF